MMHVMAAGMAGDRDPELVISDGTTVITIVAMGEGTATKKEDSAGSVGSDVLVRGKCVRLEGLPTNPIILLCCRISFVQALGPRVGSFKCLPAMHLTSTPNAV